MNFIDRADWIAFFACMGIIAGLVAYWAVSA